MPRLYLEDFTVGQVIEFGRRTVTKDEMLEFSRQFDPQPFHIDEAAAKDTIYGGLIASGWHTASIMMRLLVDGLLSKAASMGSPGVDELRWLRPVRPGDTLTARGIIKEVRPSRSKPDRGLIRSQYELTNQDGELVFTLKSMGMFARRPDE